MSPRVQAIELKIQERGHPCQRMPICRTAAKSPRQGRPGQTTLHLGVRGDVNVVIVVDELVVDCRHEGQKGAQNQDDAEKHYQTFGVLVFHLYSECALPARYSSSRRAACSARAGCFAASASAW